MWNQSKYIPLVIMNSANQIEKQLIRECQHCASVTVEAPCPYVPHLREFYKESIRLEFSISGCNKLGEKKSHSRGLSDFLPWISGTRFRHEEKKKEGARGKKLSSPNAGSITLSERRIVVNASDRSARSAKARRAR